MSNTNTQIPALVFPYVNNTHDVDAAPLFSTQQNILPAEFLLTTAAFIELLEVILAEQYDDELSDADTETPENYAPNPDDI